MLPHTDSLSVVSSSSSHQLPTPLPTPKKVRKEPEPIRLQRIGIDPKELVGKVIIRVRSSQEHPSVTLYFDDHTTFQVRVDGYDPVHRGIPKELETNSHGAAVFRPARGEANLYLTITQARFVKLKDAAYEWTDTSDCRWDVEHLALAINCAEEPGWRCVWATMAEYDGEFGPCTYRNFDDVYLEEIHPKHGYSRRRRAGRK